MSRISVTGQVYLVSQFQWAPTLTSHDPNPPITIDTPETLASIGYTSALQSPTFEAVLFGGLVR